MGMAIWRMDRLSLLELLVHKLSANHGIGVVTLPLMPKVIFRIAVQAVLGLIVPQPARAWLPQHLRRFQKGDPHPQHLHVAAASPDAPEVVLSFLLAFAPRLLGLLVFYSAIVFCCYTLGVGLAVVSLSIKPCFFV